MNWIPYFLTGYVVGGVITAIVIYWLWQESR